MAKEVVSMCNLCFENKVLIKGYIIPDWSSKLSGKTTEYVSIDSNTATSNIMALQEAFSNQTPQGPDAEYLFCLECKNALDKGEDLLREIVHPSTQQSPNISELKDFTIEFKNAKSIEKFYLALGGLVLKAHISKQDPWKNFVLTKKQKNLIVSGIKERNLSQNIQFTILKIYNLDNFKVGNFTDKIRGLYQLSPFDFANQLSATFNDAWRLYGHVRIWRVSIIIDFS